MVSQEQGVEPVKNTLRDCHQVPFRVQSRTRTCKPDLSIGNVADDFSGTQNFHCSVIKYRSQMSGYGTLVERRKEKSTLRF